MGLIKQTNPIVNFGSNEMRGKLIAWGSFISGLLLINSTFPLLKGLSTSNIVFGPVTIGVIIGVFLVWAFLVINSRQ